MVNLVFFNNLITIKITVIFMHEIDEIKTKYISIKYKPSLGAGDFEGSIALDWDDKGALNLRFVSWWHY